MLMPCRRTTAARFLRRCLPGLAGLLAGVAGATLACDGPHTPELAETPLEIKTRVFLSKPYVVDQIYR